MQHKGAQQALYGICEDMSHAINKAVEVIPAKDLEPHEWEAVMDIVHDILALQRKLWECIKK